MVLRSAFFLLGITSLVRCSGDDCGTIAAQIGDVLDDATHCDPAAQTPCVDYNTGCADVGVRPDRGDAIDALFAKYRAAGCDKVMAECPEHPPVDGFSCEDNGKGVNLCVAIEAQQ
jgi:hypothetical protein